MFNTTTLLVVSATKDPQNAEDVVNGMRWACTEPLVSVVVTEGQHYPPTIDEAKRIIRVGSGLAPEVPGCFHRGVGVRAALQCGVTFRQLMLLADTCLVLTKGLDTWFSAHADAAHLGCVGVLERREYTEEFRKAIPCFIAWGMPHQAWERPPMTLADDVLLLPQAAVGRLQEAKLLVPEESQLAQWPTHGGAYYPWALQMLGLRAVGWGLTDQAMPPLFVSSGKERLAPMLLSDRFALYSSVRDVPHYSEEYLREAYKKARGESTMTLPTFKPIVSRDPV